jgi:hypothetical protein
MYLFKNNISLNVLFHKRIIISIVFLIILLLLLQYWIEHRKYETLVINQKLLAVTIFNNFIISCEDYSNKLKKNSEIKNSQLSEVLLKEFFSSNSWGGSNVSKNISLLHNNDTTVFSFAAYIKTLTPVYVFTKDETQNYIIITTCSINNWSFTFYLDSKYPFLLYVSNKMFVKIDPYSMTFDDILQKIQSKEMRWEQFARLDNDRKIRFIKKATNKHVQ